MIKPLNEIEIIRQARNIIAGLKNTNPGDAALILQKAMGIVLTDNKEMFDDINNQAVYPLNPNLIRKRTVSKITMDIEVFKFVNEQINKNITYKQMAENCLKKFGKKRAPSKSNIGRYVKKLKDAYLKELENSRQAQTEKSGNES